jgi:hypothetical protein
MYKKATLDVIKLLGSNNSEEVINALREINKEIAQW